MHFLAPEKKVVPVQTFKVEYDIRVNGMAILDAAKEIVPKAFVCPKITIVYRNLEILDCTEQLCRFGARLAAGVE